MAGASGAFVKGEYGMVRMVFRHRDFVSLPAEETGSGEHPQGLRTTAGR